jgi:hypothetical protein
MKLEYQGRWLRLLVEFFPAWPEIRRYRISRAGLDSRMRRLLRRQVARQMRRTSSEGTP